MQKDIDPGAIRRSECVRLIVDVRHAYRQFAHLMEQNRYDSVARATLLRVTRRLSLMNRALALAALQSAQATMAGTDSPA